MFYLCGREQKYCLVMMTPNKQKELASRFINSTARHIFLTGKAGTGKTTFLKDIVMQTHKKAIVAAPTGIAAINAGGITLHSLFQLPFASYIPSDHSLAGLPVNTEIKTPKTLIRGVKFFDAKRRLLRELELLIIDEVSMLRADILDAIDTILRHVRRKKAIPFGGLQVLFIGDLLQLPPVTKNNDWEILKRFYPSMFFFNARALQQSPPLYIELEHIYRQSDPRFISLLNKIRDNKTDASDISFLNEYVKPGFDPTTQEGYIFLTTHNYKADNINNKALSKIKKPEFVYDAIVEGDFNNNMYPLEYSLHLKEGAQVMFVKNDHTGEQRYYNGKIGTVENLRKDQINVRFDDGESSVRVDRYIWENKKYSVSHESNEIAEKVTGTFSHYPLKLAWAITVHKSQGLTFEKAVIDVSSAFAPGQIYVALSRLTGLDGLVLSHALPGKPPGQDPHLQLFSDSKPKHDDLIDALRKDSMQYIRQELYRAYDLYDLWDNIVHHVYSYNKEESRSAKQVYKPWALELQSEMLDVKTVADKFLKQLKSMLKEGDIKAVQQRVNKAAAYFKPELKKLSKRIIDQMLVINGLKGVKQYTSELRELENSIFSRTQQLHKMDILIKVMLENREPTRANTTDAALQKERDNMLGAEAKKILSTAIKNQKHRKKGDSGKKNAEKDTKIPSAVISLNLYNTGKSIEDIAKIRDLAHSTIMSHMAQNVENGLLNAARFVDKEKMEQIIKASKAVNSNKLSDIMAVLGDEFTYSDIRMALASTAVPESNKKTD